ncbi:MAG: metal ABC transporter substrate-binding protein, partial [Dehalococcoidia bacterium]
DLATGSSGSDVAAISSGVTLRVVDGEPDPHVWLDADNAQVMIENVAAALSAADPDGAEAYGEAAHAYVARVQAADRAAAAAIGPVPPGDRVVITNHDSLGYLLDRYEIRSAGSVIPGLSTAAEPSARDIAGLIRAIRQGKVRLIIAEGSVEPRIARQIAADTGATIIDDLYGDTLGEPGTPTGTIDGVILFDVERIAEGLLAAGY